MILVVYSPPAAAAHTAVVAHKIVGAYTPAAPVHKFVAVYFANMILGVYSPAVAPYTVAVVHTVVVAHKIAVVYALLLLLRIPMQAFIRFL